MCHFQKGLANAAWTFHDLGHHTAADAFWIVVLIDFVLYCMFSYNKEGILLSIFWPAFISYF